MKANSVVKDSLTTAADGKQYRGLFYNLDATIAVECRANLCLATVRNYRIVQTEANRRVAENKKDIQTFSKQEVLPHASKVWTDKSQEAEIANLLEGL